MLGGFCLFETTFSKRSRLDTVMFGCDLRPSHWRRCPRRSQPPSRTERPSARMIALEQALSELREGVVVELLEQLSEVPPEYSETIVLDLLHEMAEDRF
jgi:hypothetical protein